MKNPPSRLACRWIATALLAALFCPLTVLRADASDTHVLLAKDATLKGDVAYDAKGDLIDNWSGAGSFVSWKLTGIPPGFYKVAMVYGLQGKKLIRSFSISTGSDTKKIANIPLTGSWSTLKNETLAPLKIAPTDTTLTITADDIPPHDYLMNLQKVILTKSLDFGW